MMRKFILLAVASAMASYFPAWAVVKPVGQFRDWRVYTEEVGNDTVCFASTNAAYIAPKTVTHGDIHFFVANWKSGAAVDQPSLKVGYELRSDQPPKASVGNSDWSMYSVNDEAFFETREEKQVVAALKKGAQLRVEAVSKRGTNTAYHFSLKGSTAAINKAREICK